MKCHLYFIVTREGWSKDSTANASVVAEIFDYQHWSPEAPQNASW